MMHPFSFVHAADLHIDSPFRGVTVDAVPASVSEALYASTFRAFDALIDFTIDQAADFLLVAGDVYDGRDRSLRAQLRLRDGLARLDEAGIQSFVVHGNHDPLDSRVAALEWPGRARFFGRKLESFPACAADGSPLATVSGISFPHREEARNLAARFRRQDTGLFHIGLLHCNVGGDTGHENYAPCTLEDLRQARMDYWALGHVHSRAVLSREPWVVYPGNIQGRSIREPGARGCMHVRVDEDGQVTTSFVALDSVRWCQVNVSIERVETVDALERALLAQVRKVATAAPDRGQVLRAAITGRGPLHGQLRRDGAADQLLERIRERLADTDPFLWVQRLHVDSAPEVDLAERTKGQDLLAAVLTAAAEYRVTPAALSLLYERVLAALWENSRVARAHFQRPSVEQLETILREAELLCLDLLEEPE